MRRETLAFVLQGFGLSGSIVCLVVVMLQRGDFYLLALPLSNLCFALGVKLVNPAAKCDGPKGVK